jgi:hypothetical protein
MRALLLVPVILAASCDDRSASTPPLEPEEGRKEWESYQEKDQGAQRVSQKDPHDPQQGETLRWREFLRICRDRDLTELQKKTFVLGQRVRWSGQLVAADTPRLRKVIYWMKMAQREGLDPANLIDLGLHANRSAGTPRAKLLRESLVRTYGKPGCLDVAGIGKPVIQRPPRQI